ncbi:glycerophosphodiester phosphodiesterase [Alteromonas sp. BL110]|uniref:glycerophosphodiester phosphodiesterase n=1 Tax=Alteromonas sp. BL110 TaxID=1714845 RepID=UPI001E378C28|nr:glycerophosphodiester phosphodiesterase [Alteromonas sp. BL110]
MSMLIFAHRGASKVAPENTLKAFKLAFEQDADGIEFDTYQHDSGIIVFHDRTLKRRARETGYLLDTPWQSLKQMDIGDGEHIPSLSQSLQCVPNDKWCNIEIKHLNDVHSWVKDVKKAIKQSSISTDKLLISSFNHHWLKAVTLLWPEVKIGALTASYELDCTASARALSAYSVNIALDAVNKQFVQTALQEGFDVFVYTVDEPRDMLMLKEWGVTGIFTNLPNVALNTLSY